MKLIGYFLALVIIVSLFFLPSRLITISAVECNSQFGKCNPAVEEKLKIGEGKKMYQARNLIKQELKNNFLLKDYSIFYKLPNKYKVSVIEKKAAWSIKNVNLGVVYLVSKEGEIVSLTKSSNLPVLLMRSFQANLGDRVDANILFALNLLDNLYKMYSVSSVTHDNGSVSAKIENGPLVIFPDSGEMDVLIGSLRLVLEKINEDDQNFRIEKKTRYDYN